MVPSDARESSRSRLHVDNGNFEVYIVIIERGAVP
jgi:hypothetical protein